MNAVRASMMRMVAVLLFLLSAAPPTSAQTSDPPRTPEGRPDLQGIWQVLNAAEWDIQAHAARLGVPAGQSVVEGDEVPYQPAAAATQKENFASQATADPVAKCFLPGVPRATYMPFPFQIFQTPRYVVITYEYDHAIRVIYTDGTTHPESGLAFWMGDSRGHWEGDTLVVDVTNFTDQTWFDKAGNFHTEALHVVERYTRTGADHLAYEVTIEDPSVFTKPWKMRMPIYRRQEKPLRILEYECGAYLDEVADRKK